MAHGDVRETNVLDNNGIPFIVNFDYAVDHHCHCVKEMLFWRDLAPSRADLDCDELYDLGTDLSIWRGSESHLPQLL